METWKLKQIDVWLLATLPPEPHGKCLWDLADGVLGDMGPGARGVIRRALERLDAVVGCVFKVVGNVPDLDRFGVVLYGVRRAKRRIVRKIIADRWSTGAALASTGEPQGADDE